MEQDAKHRKHISPLQMVPANEPEKKKIKKTHPYLHFGKKINESSIHPLQMAEFIHGQDSSIIHIFHPPPNYCVPSMSFLADWNHVYLHL